MLSEMEKQRFNIVWQSSSDKDTCITTDHFTAALLHVPQNVISELNRMFYQFLWGKVEPLKRLKVIKMQSDGGLGMVDLDSIFSSFKAAWVSCIFKADPEKDNWVQIPISIFSQLGGLDVLREFSFEHCSEMSELDHIPLFYKDVIVSYSKAFTLDFEAFKNTILNQPLWGNRFITIRKRDKKNVLLLRNWIRSGVRYVKDVMFTDGIVDRTTCELIEDKRNIHIEYLYVKKTLLPYVNYILLAQNQNMQLLYDHKDVNTKSNLYYIDFLCKKVSDITIMSPFFHPYCIENDIDEATIFVRRVCQEKEKKLKEFNFKVLHGIMPCGVNLKKWKIRNTSSCDVCDKEQTIVHLLFECEYISGLWAKVKQALDTDSVCGSVICGTLDGNYQNNNIVITLVSFLIYKDWLLHSLDNKKRPSLFNMEIFKSELQLRMKIYEKCNMIVHVNQIINLLSFL